MDKLDKYKQIVETSLQEIKNILTDCSYTFISESDFQFTLTQFIKKELNRHGQLEKVEFNLGNNEGIKYSTILHTEYPPGTSKINRFDIAILDETSMQENTDWNDKKINYAIELKYSWKLDNRTKYGFLADIEKIIKAKEDKRINYGTAILLSTETNQDKTITELKKEMTDLKEDYCTNFIVTPESLLKI